MGVSLEINCCPGTKECREVIIMGVWELRIEHVLFGDWRFGLGTRGSVCGVQGCRAYCTLGWGGG